MLEISRANIKEMSKEGFLKLLKGGEASTTSNSNAGATTTNKSSSSVTVTSKKSKDEGKVTSKKKDGQTTATSASGAGWAALKDNLLVDKTLKLKVSNDLRRFASVLIIIFAMYMLGLGQG